ncbi:MAG TPA: hypothetical protein VL137_07140 [Polyangiaceae bacterium]|nr:hypothetical protein [Polyangiaceae bacterium]
MVNSNDARLLSAWRQWLGALATDAEAAHAAAMAYKQLEPEARAVWIEALASDACAAGVPKIAVYAPLLAVESDPVRRQQIHAALGTDEPVVPRTSVRALFGSLGAQHVVAIIMPLYLDFVQVFACGYVPGRRFDWVRHDPIVLSTQAPRAGTLLESATLELKPLKAVIDDLALTVLGHRRAGLELPSALEVLSELFEPFVDDDVPASA